VRNGMFKRIGAVLMPIVALVLAPTVAWAQQGDGFVPATDIVRETLPASPFVYVAYAFVWVALVAYILLLWQRLNKVERELADVTARLAKRR
jgi:CcmD family protein